MLLDQVVLSLIAFSFFHWVGPRSSDHYALRFWGSICPWDTAVNMYILIYVLSYEI